MASVLAFANHKGGCGKTTAVGNIGAALGEMGASVLLIDADPQANLSELFGVGDPYAPGARLEDALIRDEGTPVPEAWTSRLDEAGQSLSLPAGVSILPCTTELSSVVADNAAVPGFEFALRRLTESYGALYDYILIDTPPGLQPLSTQALIAAQWVVVPARPADFDVGGAVKVADLIETDIAALNPEIAIFGVLVCQSDRRWVLGRETEAALDAASIRRLPDEVPFAIRVGSAPRYGRPTFALEPDSRVASAYRRVASHVHDTLTAQAA